MGMFRVCFDIGWSSVVIHARSREEAVEKVWEALGELGHGAVEGLRLGSYMVSVEHAVELDETTPQGASLQEFVARTKAYAKSPLSV